MNFRSHASFGLFTALLAYYLTANFWAAATLFLIQIGLILDFILNKTIEKEPFHSIAMMLVVWALSYFFIPSLHLYVLIAYATHLFLDIWVDEKIPLLWPSKFELMYPVRNSESVTTWASLIGSIVLLFLLL